jgi:hypothetical protein
LNSRPISTDQLAWLVTPRTSLEKLIVFLAAYLDESSDAKKETFIGVGGLLASQAHWLRFEHLWGPVDKALRERGAVYHTTDLESTGGDFKGWDHQECKGYIRKMVESIVDPYLLGCNSSVDVQAFRRIFPHDKDDAMYFLCFQSCIVQMAEWGEELGEPVAFVFDDRPDLIARASRLYTRMKSEVDWDNRSRLGTLSFSSRSLYLGLQAADLIAYEAYKLLDYSPKSGRIRGSIQSISKTGRLQGRYWDEERLIELREDVIRSRAGTVDSLLENELKEPKSSVDTQNRPVMDT